jgi:hypothetical protein
MTDEEARQQVERTEAFIAAFRALIASTVVDPASPCEAACRRGLERIAATVDAVDYVTYANLANINEAMRGGLMSVMEVRLMCVGGGPTLDFQDASAFLAGFQSAIDAALKEPPAIRGQFLTTGSRGVLLRAWPAQSDEGVILASSLAPWHRAPSTPSGRGQDSAASMRRWRGAPAR